jgi:hypothetical protein
MDEKCVAVAIIRLLGEGQVVNENLTDRRWRRHILYAVPFWHVGKPLEPWILLSRRQP